MAEYKAYYTGVKSDGSSAETNAPIRAPNNGLAVVLSRNYLLLS